MLGKQWGVNDGIGVLVNGQKIDLAGGIVDINVGDEVTLNSLCIKPSGVSHIRCTESMAG